jgi:hypothetical protein
MYLALMGLKNADAISKLFGALAATFGEDGLDFGLAVNAGERLDQLGILAGLKVKNGRRIEQTLRDLHRDLSPEVKGMIPVNWNHDRHGSARIHKAKLASEMEPTYLAVRDDVVFLGQGEAGLRALKAALDTFGKSEPAASPLLSAHAQSKYWLSGSGIVERLGSEVSPEERDKLMARLSIDGGKDFRVRGRFSLQLLRLLLPPAKK